MDHRQRGRSPSADQQVPRSLNHSPSPSAQTGFTSQANAQGADPTLLSSNSFNQNTSAHRHSFSDSNFLSPALSQQYTHHPNSSQHSFEQFPGSGQDTQYQNHFDPSDTSQQAAFSASVNPQFLDATNENSNQGLQEFLAQNTQFGSQQQQQMPNNPEDFPLFKDVSNSYNQYHSPGHSYNNSLSQPFDQSAAFPQGAGTRSRGQSLSPSSAAVPPGQRTQEWGSMAFQGHRRNPSADAFSDISSQHSPFVDAMESFDGLSGTSPNLQAQADPSMVNDSLGGFGQFTLSDPNIAPSQHTSPGQSNHVSPHMSPQQGVAFESTDNFGILAPDPGPPMFDAVGPGIEAFPKNVQFSTSEGVGSQIAPEINIQLASEQQPPMNEPGRLHDPGRDALSPPSRSPSRQRGRATSDPYSSANVSRSSTPARPRAPSLGLHPAGSARSSRSPSPSAPPNGITKPRDRASSTPSIPAQREYMLGLADPERQQSLSSSPAAGSASSAGGEAGRGRGQKHPATFQCTLCPKRFTRAYNLRSHLRTHTDERPFVCTVCGKAFARQHDRKRHEGLHSGEKKFVCKGLLGSGSPWGCGRRFARADALGRHFRSEAGRACIKPLLEEEARERRAAMMEQANQDMINQQQQAGMQQAAPPMGFDPNTGAVDMSGMTLPAALLAQYPALAGIQWDALPSGPGSGGLDVDEGELDDYGPSGRSSFDASSGGELDFEDDGSFDPNVMAGGQGWNQGGMGQQSQMGQQAQWTGGYGGA